MGIDTFDEMYESSTDVLRQVDENTLICTP